MPKYKSPVGMFMVVTPHGLPISYSKRATREDSIAQVVEVMGKTWVELEAKGYRCAVIGQPVKQ